MLGHVLRHGLVLVLCGVTVGPRVLTAVGRDAVRIDPHDPLTCLASAFLPGGAAVLASLVFAWRPARVAPSDVRRSD